MRYPQERARAGQRELFPDRKTLVDIALFEKRFDEAIALHGEMGKERIAALGLGRVVARAVAKTHPEVALAIWRGIVDRLIAETTPRAYTAAGTFLGQMRKAYKACGRKTAARPQCAGVFSACAGPDCMLECKRCTPSS